MRSSSRERWRTGKGPSRLPILVAVVFAATLAAAVSAAQSAGAQSTSAGSSASASAASGGAKNVILFIGDGMGDSEITIARNYHLGAAGEFAMDTLPMTGAYTTYSVLEDDPATPDYVPDSAATGTAWATGSKTSNNRVSTTAKTDENLATILELAQRSGRLTGNVSTAELTDATPAVLDSHVAHRDCKGPEDMDELCSQDKKANGGPGSIAEQSVDHGVDVLLGGARSGFEQTIGAGPDEGKTVVESAERQGYDVVYDADAMEAARPGGKLLGLFAEENMDLLYSGEPAEADHDFEPQTCKEGQLPPEQPDLASMTTKAIEMLEGGGRGFFLQVESASIDKEDHISNPCEQIGETVNLDNAVAVGLEYAEANPDTLVVVTGDHGHTSQIIPSPEGGYYEEGYEYDVPGEAATLNTADGTTMTVSYATNTFRDENGEIIEGEDSEDSHTHTGTQIRIAAQGPGSEGVLGLTDQTELFDTMAASMGLEASASASATATASAGASAVPDTGGFAPAWLAALAAAVGGLGLLVSRRVLRGNG